MLKSSCDLFIQIQFEPPLASDETPTQVHYHPAALRVARPTERGCTWRLTVRSPFVDVLTPITALKGELACFVRFLLTC
ncbi:MAG: hypothetical protein O2856_20095 [Planctomycetota bacterium]|nr:hypothetical protein [Planctomycetota bacterium]